MIITEQKSLKGLTGYFPRIKKVYQKETDIGNNWLYWAFESEDEYSSFDAISEDNNIINLIYNVYLLKGSKRLVLASNNVLILDHTDLYTKCDLTESGLIDLMERIAE